MGCVTGMVSRDDLGRVDAKFETGLLIDDDEGSRVLKLEWNALQVPKSSADRRNERLDPQKARSMNPSTQSPKEEFDEGRTGIRRLDDVHSKIITENPL